jgi:hypothetical protein
MDDVIDLLREALAIINDEQAAHAAANDGRGDVGKSRVWYRVSDALKLVVIERGKQQ